MSDPAVRGFYLTFQIPNAYVVLPCALAVNYISKESDSQMWSVFRIDARFVSCFLLNPKVEASIAR